MDDFDVSILFWRERCLKMLVFNILFQRLILVCILIMDLNRIIQSSYCKPKLFHNTKINIPNCFQTKVTMNRCIGACLSTYNKNGNNEFSYSCCQPFEFSNINVTLRCRGAHGVVRLTDVVIKNPTSCKCNTLAWPRV